MAVQVLLKRAVYFKIVTCSKKKKGSIVNKLEKKRKKENCPFPDLTVTSFCSLRLSLFNQAIVCLKNDDDANAIKY